MSNAASSSQSDQTSKHRLAQSGRTLVTFALAIALLCGMFWDGIESRYADIFVGRATAESDSVVLPIALADLSADEILTAAVTDIDIQVSVGESCPQSDSAALSLLESAVVLGRGNAEAISHVPRTIVRTFAATYRSVRKLAAIMEVFHSQDEFSPSRAVLFGTASTYNPYRDGKQEGDAQTASGELYDPASWTAAIQVGLREQFGGVRYGRLYQPTYALVESGAKQVIVKVNDVGHLRPGRVLDLNERSMRYFDPFLTRGLLADVKITLLPGEDWTPGPIGGAHLAEFVATDWFAASTKFAAPSQWQTEMSRLPAPHHAPATDENIRAEAKSSVGG
jgi:rare lipoprotein A